MALSLPYPVVAQVDQAEEASLAQEPAELTLFQTVVLGLVEGLTEYLPVSSTGHLILAAHFMGLSEDTILIDQQGTVVFLENPSTENPIGTPLTLEAGIDAYTIIIQFGAIAAVVFLYWQKFLGILFGIFGKNPNGLMLLRNLVLAFLPAAGLGLLLENIIDRYLFGPGPVVAALFLGGIAILMVDRWYKKTMDEDQSPKLHELTVKNCLFIGLLQCVAMWPGTSRSMMTIIGGYLVRLSPTRAAEFSFLLGFVTLSAASIYKGYKVGQPLVETFGLGMPLLGCIIAAVSATVAVKWMVTYLEKHGLGIFGYYRIALSAGLALVFFL
ncbi:MAG: UDP-diphosphatase [Opitutaceae bacterium]|nr:UDP-diphosphatase [Opitutaceae bacterium]|tara:strand:+ start:1681 stop:2661 length:981 start_codon:yes stop_codon:yes gene_type:complete